MVPENTVDKRATAALHLEHVRGLRLRDLSVAWSDGEVEPKWSNALVLRRTSDFAIDGFWGRQGLAGTEEAAILLDDAADGAIVNARAGDGCRRLVHVQGDTTRAIMVRDCTVPDGSVAVTYADPGLKDRVRIS
jgi:hypothetical protein